jgi:PAS domain S-box-containing protein
MRIVGGEERVECDAEKERKDGSKVPCIVTATPFVGPSGELIGIVEDFKDITERRGAEEALRESQERYRRLWDDAPVAYHRLDTKGIILQVNQTEMNMLGYARDEMVGKPIFEFIQLEQRKDAEERFRRKLAGVDVPKQHDRIYVRKDGSSICVSIDDRLERDAEGQVVGIRTTMVDVSKRKKAEDALRESEKKYSTLVESSLTGIYIDQDEKIVFANNRFADICAYQREKLIGIETWRLVHPEDRQLTESMRKRRLSGEDVPSEYEARGLTKDGETIWVKRRNSRIEYQGRPAILGNIVDITEQKGAEEELRKINKELKSFVDVVSHDLKTPIIAIQGFSSRLFKNHQEELGEKGERYLELINASARRMEVLVSDLLALSSSGQVLSTLANVSSLEIVENVSSGLRDKLEENRIELVVTEDLPPIYCDGERIYQVFENLLVNAIKYMGDTENPRIEIGFEDSGRFHQFYVRDNGVGIDAKYHQKVFEMFHRLREVEKEEGTGLGLAIVERIVNNHGGRVWVESEPEKGSTFYFTIPVAV